MIKHIVLFKLKDKQNITQAQEMLMSMKGKVDLIKSIEVGVDLLHTERSYDVALIVTLDDLAALNAYRVDPYHDKVVRAFMRSIAESSVIVDYEL